MCWRKNSTESDRELRDIAEDRTMASTALIISSHLVLLLLIIIKTGHTAGKHTGQLTAEAPGDIMIGILYPLHGRVVKNYNKPCSPWPRKCYWFHGRALTDVLMLINAIEWSNKFPLLRRVNITLGYRVLDYCGDVSTALRLTADLVQQHDCHAGRRQPIMAVVGPPTSEVSMAIARQLTFNSIPQISPSSTAERLSDKDQFPAFLRTVPSDKHKTAAMVRFIQKRKWSSVGVVTTVDEYGRAPLDFFVPNDLTKNICVAFQILLPASSDSLDFNNKIMSAAETICNHNNVKVIVIYAGAAIMESLLQEMKNWTLRNLNSSESMRRVWLASGIWSPTVEGNLSLKEIGHVVGFTFQYGDQRSFNWYLHRLEKTKRLDSINNGFLQKFFNLIRSYYRVRTDAEVLSRAVKILKDKSRVGILPSLEMAVSAIAHAVSSLCWRRDCKTPGKVQPHELLEILKKQKFKYGRKTYSFTKEGDLYRNYVVTLGMPRKKGEEKRKIIHYMLAEYDIFAKNFTWNSWVIRTQEFMELKNTTSRCFNTCMPGTIKKSTGGQQDCCYKCINCTKNHYSDEKDMDKCKKCGKEEWSAAGSPNCRQKTVDYFSWDDSFAIAPVTSTALGIILVLMVSALFFHQADTPIVKAAGGPLCQVILFSLLVSYISAILFVGQPNSIQCKSRQVLFGISFTLCVSCILVKSLKILLAFQFNPGLQDVLRRLYRPYIIIGVVVGMQVIICTCWLLLRGPEKDVEGLDAILLEQCNEGSHVAFWVMLGYIAVLAFVCLVCAFKGRRLPQEYNDAKSITFSMLLNVISWMLFIIIQVTTKGKYLSAVEMIVILISNYSILCCHFFPKCHTILFKKEKNTKSVFRQNLYAYSNQTTEPFSVSGGLGSESQCSCQHITASALTLPVPAAPLKPAVVTDYKETNTPVHLYPGLLRGSITHRRLKRHTSM